MFKRDHAESISSPSAAAAATQTRTAAPRGGGTATIGPSITIRGEVGGDEDLIVQGRIEGTVNLAKHSVTIGASGKVKADVYGKTVVVEGEVVGDVEAAEQIVLRRSAVVEGNIRAPRVALEDGAVFRGGIEMEAAPKPGGARGVAPREPSLGVDRESGPAKEVAAPGPPAKTIA